MASAGQGAALGLESGFRLAMDMHDRRRQNERQDRQDARQEGLDQQMRDDRTYTRGRQEYSDAVAANTAEEQHQAKTAQRYADGTIVPSTAEQQQFAFEQQGTEARGKALRASPGKVGLDGGLRPENPYDPAVVARNAQLGKQLLDTNNLAGFTNSKPGMFTQTVTASTGHPPDYYRRGPNGEPAQSELDMKAVQDGLERGDHESMLSGANAMLKSEINVGVGGQGAQGGTIVEKRLVGLTPHPGSSPDDLQLIPKLRVFVNNGKAEASGDEMRARRSMGPDTPQDATGHYDAAMTQNRSTDPNDPTKSVSAKMLMDKMGQYQQLTEMMNRPEAEQLLAHDAQSTWNPQTFLDSVARTGAKKTPEQTQSLDMAPGHVYMERKIDPITKQVIPGSETRMEGNPKQASNIIELAQEQAKADPEKRGVNYWLNELQSVDSAKTKAANRGLEYREREADRRDLHDQFQRADAVAKNARVDLEKFEDNLKKRGRSERENPANAAERTRLNADVKRTSAEVDALSTAMRKPVPAPAAEPTGLGTQGPARGVGPDGVERQVTPEVQAARDVQAGKMIMAEDGGAASAPARLKVLRDAAAQAGTGKGSSDTRAIMTHQADILEAAMKAGGADVKKPTDRKPLASFGSDAPKPTETKPAAAPKPAAERKSLATFGGDTPKAAAPAPAPKSADEIPEPPPQFRQSGLSNVPSPAYADWKAKYGKAWEARDAADKAGGDKRARDAKNSFNPYAQTRVN